MEEQIVSQEQVENSKNKTGKFAGFTKVIGNVVFAVAMAIAALMIFSLVQAKVSGGPPAIAGYRMYIVLSGSMNPAFDTGSLVFVKPSGVEDIKNGDIITYRGLGDGEQLISHRVVAVNQTEDGISFTTKGDANDAEDPNPVTSRNLVGKVVLAIPYLGYFLNFTHSKQGIIFLILIPAAIILITEGINLYNNVKALKKENKGQDSSKSHAEV